jgi:O-glycosyl hydrolase
MPIKPFNVGEYERIPEEDVTPMNSNISRMVKRNAKGFRIFVAVAVAVLCLLGLIYTGYYVFDKEINDVSIFETASANLGQNGLQEIEVEHLKKSIPALKSIKFGNLECEGDEQCGDARLSRITVNPSISFQEIVGFGGAFTEASAYHFYKLPTSLQQKFIDLYFGIDGIGFTMGRIHINSCDFSFKSYSFDDIPDDYNLDFFDNDVTHDNIQIIPFIMEAMDASPRHIKLVASPWSPPAWMKRPVHGNQSMTGSATPSGLRDEPKVKLSWAHYLSKFISAYKDKGIPIWAITPQNEPEFPAPWEACTYNAKNESDFIQEYLGPILRAEHPELKILGFDHNKDHLEAWTRELIGADDAHGYVDGMAFHWYGGMDRMTDGTYGYNAVKAAHEYAPNKLLINTEGCSCPGVKINDWFRAERLGHDLLFDLENFAQGWIDWNLILDETGGPNHLGNNCDASLIAMDGHTSIHVQPKFYYFGHFSKFIVPGSLRVESLAIGDYGFDLDNANIQANIELGMYHCERSSRQMWVLDDKAGNGKGNSGVGTDKMKLRLQAVAGSTSDRLCLAQGDGNRVFLRLIDCDYVDASIQFITIDVKSFSTGSNAFSERSSSSNANSVQLQDGNTGMCVSTTEMQRGALLVLRPCITEANEETYIELQKQKFVYNRSTNEVKQSTVEDVTIIDHKSSDLCLTAGWPFLNAISFVTPPEGITGQQNTVVIVMNEAAVPVPISLRDSTKRLPLVFATPGHSIQTIIYKN